VRDENGQALGYFSFEMSRSRRLRSPTQRSTLIASVRTIHRIALMRVAWTGLLITGSSRWTGNDAAWHWRQPSYSAKREKRSRRFLDVPARRLLKSVRLAARVKGQAETERFLPGRAFGAF